MSSIGHNNPPSDLRFTPKAKIARILDVLNRDDLTAIQKCVGVALVATCDLDGSSGLTTPELMRVASAKDKATVFSATRALQDSLVTKVKVPGKPNTFRVLPRHVIDGVIEAYVELKTGTIGSAQSEDGDLVGLNRPSGSEPASFNPPGGFELVGFDRTSMVQSYQPPRAPAYKELPSEVLDISEESEEKKELVLFVGEEPSAEMQALKAFQTYNELAQRVGIPIARSLTPSRRKSIICRLRENGGYPAWEAVLNNISRSAFLQGHNDRDWVPPGLDWFLKSANFTKVFEGVYGNGAHAQNHPRETDTERLFRLAERVEDRQRRLTQS